MLAWGNESRGDDAIGTIIARRIGALRNVDIEIIEDHQLNIEHVMDIRDEVPVLFVDASVAIDSGYMLEKLAPLRDDSICTHSVSPVALLDLYEQTLGKTAPSAYLLHVGGSSFELGEGISDAAGIAVNRAWQFLSDLFARPRDQWLACLEAASSASLVPASTTNSIRVPPTSIVSPG